MTEYLSPEEVVAVHHDQIMRYGGLDGVRDYGLLEAAVFRPQAGYGYDITEKAAALWESLSQNHPFIDGNKRTAFAAMYTFLALNHIQLRAQPDETYQFIIRLHQNRIFDHKHLSAWIRQHTLQSTL